VTTTVPNKSPSSGVQGAKKPTAAPAHAAVATTAYEIWISEGKQSGFDQKNWFAAEAQLQRV
jgi:hypothetical protein